MKNIIFATLMVMIGATFAFAITVTGKVPINVTAGADGAVTTSDAYQATGKKYKSMFVTGATDASTAAAPVFQTMSGTVVAECAPTSAGPWTTCVANDYAQTAVSRTTNGQFTWSDVSEWIRVKWTATTTSTKLKAWLFYSE